MTSIQSDDVNEFETERANCNLFDAFTPFNCISCHPGFALNVQTKQCETVSSPVTYCEEYISISKPICIRCKTGYILDYGINTDIFNTPVSLSNSSFLYKFI